VNAIWVKRLPAFVQKRLDGRHHLQKVIGNISWLFADKILRMGVGLFVGVWMARYLGPERFGIFSYVIAFVGLFNVVATLGLDSIVVRDLVHDSKLKNEMLGTTFALKLVGAIASIVLTLSVITALRPGDSEIRWMVAILAGGAIFQAFDAIDFWFQSRVESKYSVYAKNGAFLGIACAKIVLILSGAALIAFVWTAFAEVVLGALGLVLAYKISGHRISRWTGNMRLARGLLQRAWPLIFAGAAVAIYVKIDQVMLGEMLGNKAVGIYSAAVRLSELWYFIPVAIVSSVTPALIEARKINEKLYYERLARLFRLVVWIGFAIAIPTTFASGLVIKLIYGQQYMSSGTVLAIHIWAIIAVSLGVAQSVWTVNEGLMKWALVRTSIGAISNIVLNLLLIPVYGVIGAAVATVVSYCLSDVIANAFYKKTRRIFVLELKAMNPLAVFAGHS